MSSYILLFYIRGINEETIFRSHCFSYYPVRHHLAVLIGLNLLFCFI